MPLYYSKSTNGFYDDQISATRPADAVAITADQHTALLNAQTAGQTIASDASGNPVALAPGLAQVQSAQVDVLSAACRAAITGGFASSALGSAHTYGSQASDQQNLSDALGSALANGAGFSTPLWCAVGAAWIFAAHSAAQVQQVHADWLAFRVAQQNKLINLKAQVNAAATPEAVAAAAW